MAVSKILVLALKKVRFWLLNKGAPKEQGINRHHCSTCWSWVRKDLQPGECPPQQSGRQSQPGPEQLAENRYQLLQFDWRTDELGKYVTEQDFQKDF
ncbi:hypothetical protein Y1Q_0012492 [Alligator mississippiensis]|uniref:Uncharacterized protein n=1 Tax=Alligator mississippiensis TaxID=8496 RepID=A0A151M7V1_ALLMI|nr:hypothetical protein Y1Q_0012492 [Alligator mississippiensis]